jgi:hypothetical protein
MSAAHAQVREVREVRVEYTPPPTVDAMWDSEAPVRCIVGPVGSGKSSGCIMELVRRAGEQWPGPDGVRRSRWALIRNTRPQLKDTTCKTFEAWVPEETGAWNEQNMSFTLRAYSPTGALEIEAEFLFRALDKPRDVRKVLSLELTGAYVNEAREIAKEVFDGLQGRVGRYPSKKDGGCKWRGVIADTNPWPTNHWGYRLFSIERPEGFDLFEQPGGLSDEAENVDNLEDGYYRRISQGKDAEWVDEYVHGKYPTHDRGSVYGEVLHQLEARGGICDFEHPRDGVFLNFDLGISDSTALWWWRLAENGVEFVDHYEAHGKGLSHYFGVVRERPWQLRKIWLPHDARARTLATGRSIQDQFNTEFGAGMVAIGPPLDVADGIAATRKMFEYPGTRIHSRCRAITGDSDIDGIEALREYRYEYDETKKVYKRSPLHNWASHSADAARYVACVVQVSELLTRKAPSTKPKNPMHIHSSRVELDDSALFRPSGTGRGSSRI